jgi:hypothetical protein
VLYLGGMATEDTIITHVTEARTAEHARAIVNKYPPRVLAKVADLLYIDAEGHGAAWLRAAIVSEARA